jgi:hypothetical protein
VSGILERTIGIARRLTEAGTVAFAIADTITIAGAIAAAGAEAVALTNLAACVVNEISDVDLAFEIGHEPSDFS